MEIHRRCAATSFEVHRGGVCVARVGRACELTAAEREELFARIGRSPYVPNQSRRELQESVGNAFVRTMRDTRATGLFVSADTMVIAEVHDFALVGVVGVALMCIGDSAFAWWSGA